VVVWPVSGSGVGDECESTAVACSSSAFTKAASCLALQSGEGHAVNPCSEISLIGLKRKV